MDDVSEWLAYPGWETLVSLTHLAFAHAVPEKTLEIMQTLPTVRYVVIGCHYDNEMYRFIDAAVEDSPQIRAVWGIRVVFLSTISSYDWKQATRRARFLGRCGTGGKEAH